jgi:hypothetical protein
VRGRARLGIGERELCLFVGLVEAALLNQERRSLESFALFDSADTGALSAGRGVRVSA